jgi:peptide/nickel transport system ATP-binding protein
VVELGTGSEIFETPAHPYTRSLIEAIPGRANEALMVY